MNINSELFLDINNLANKNHAVDTLFIFGANYLIYIIFAATIGIMAFLIYRREWKTAAWFFASLVTSFLILKVIQYIHPGVRPFTVEPGVKQLIQHAAGISFPSDHTTVTSAIAFSMLFLTRFKATGWILLIGALFVGFSRIFVGVHYPLDILAGIGTGLVGASVVGIIYRIARPREELMKFDNHSKFNS